METKKKKKADIYRHRGLFINIGLVISLFLVTSAFHLKFYEGEVVDPGTIGDNFDTIIEIPPTTQPPPAKPKPIVQPRIVEVIDEEVIEDVIEYTFEPTIIEEVDLIETEEDEEVAETIFEVVEEQPSPVGGLKAFNEFLSKNLKYPSQARRMGIEGKVFLQFVVDKDGSLTDIKVLKGIGAGCDAESLRVLKAHPKWNAGKQRGRPVKVRMVVPVTFRLQ